MLNGHSVCLHMGKGAWQRASICSTTIVKLALEARSPVSWVTLAPTARGAHLQLAWRGPRSFSVAA